MRRERKQEDIAVQQQQQEAPSLTPFQERCKALLEQRFGRVVDGTSFGAHFHCYRKLDQERQQQQPHQHGEALVLCIDNDDDKNKVAREKLAFDLRYLSVASRVASSTRKRLLVAIPVNDSDVGIELLEFTSMT